MKTRRIVYQRKNTRIGSSFLVFHYPFVLLFHKQERNLKRLVPFMVPRKRKKEKKRKEKGMLFPSFVKVVPNCFGFQEFFFLIRKKIKCRYNIYRFGSKCKPSKFAASVSAALQLFLLSSGPFGSSAKFPFCSSTSG